VQVGPTGTVAVIWTDLEQKPFALRIAQSYDGGKTFPVQNRLVTELMTAGALANPLPGASFFPGHILSSFTIAADGTFYDVSGRRRDIPW
jgi:hypothetical protein